jgi:hypothetical protein
LDWKVCSPTALLPSPHPTPTDNVKLIIFCSKIVTTQHH